MKINRGPYTAIAQAHEFNGADAGEQIATAIADAPSVGAVISAVGLYDAQVWSSDPFSGGSVPVTLELGAGTTTVSTDVTIPAHVTVRFNQGSILSINSGKTLTVEGAIEAPRSTIFTGAGAVAFTLGSRQAKVYPQWWGGIADYGTGNTDNGPPIGKAINSGARRIVLTGGEWGIGSPVTINVPNWILEGDSRVYTDVLPLATDIHVGSGANAMFVNSNNATNAIIQRIRFTSAIAFTGWVIWAEEAVQGGQCLFSTIIRDNWISMGTGSTGFFHGGLNDSFFVDNDIENTRTVFDLAGAGIACCSFIDNHLTGNVGSFINCTANASNIMQVTGLYASSQEVDYLFRITNGANWQISKIYLEYAGSTSTAAGGIAALTGMTTSTFIDFIASRTSGRMAAFLINGCTDLKISKGIVKAGGWAGATTGTFDISGAVVLDVEDVTLIDDLGIQIAFHGPSGTMKVSNCTLNRGASYGIVDLAASTLNLTIQNSVIKNVAYGGSALPYASLSTSGNVYIRNSTMGKDDATSAATYIFQGLGSGDFFVDEVTFIGGLNLSGGGTTQIIRSGNTHGSIGAIFHAQAMPAAGSWAQGDIVINSLPGETGPNGAKYIIAGWIRVTTGSNNVLNTDWFQMRTLTGN